MLRCMRCGRRCHWQDWHDLGWVKIPAALDEKNGEKFICRLCWDTPVRQYKTPHSRRMVLIPYQHRFMKIRFVKKPKNGEDGERG